MRSTDIKTLKFKDKLAAQRRQRFLATLTGIGIIVIAALVGIGYALFFTPWFVIRNVSISGLDENHTAAVSQVVNERLNKKILSIPTGHNILFFGAGNLATDLAKEFSFLHDISINKKYLHGLIIAGTERQAEGVWCFTDLSGSGTADNCHYYDHDGVVWGDAIQSSGSLLLNINDLRDRKGETIDKPFLAAIQTVSRRLTTENIKIKNITIPADSLVELNVAVSDGYLLKFSLDSDIPGQLDVYKIFKQNQIDSKLIQPQYLDLRFDGRVYYK